MTAYMMRISDWSSDVCSSDLGHEHREGGRVVGPHQPFRRPAGAEPDEIGEAALMLGGAPQRRKGVAHAHAATPARAAAIAGARPAAHLVMSPAPRQITRSPGWIVSASHTASASASATPAAVR